MAINQIKTDNSTHAPSAKMKFKHIVLSFLVLGSLTGAELNPVALDDNDVIVDDMIYDREQYFKDYFNIR